MATKRQSDFIHCDSFLDASLGESDRGSVLIACHVLDAALEHSLRSHFSRRRVVVNRAVNSLFEPMRPLSSLAAKGQLAYALGLIPDWAFEDLQTIRTLRNSLAHSTENFSFDSAHSRSTIRRLNCTRMAVGDTGRRCSVDRAVKQCATVAASFASQEGALIMTPEKVYFHTGFNFLHGFLTKGKAYKERKNAVGTCADSL